MFILSFTSNGLKCLSVSNTSINKNPDLKVFKNTKFVVGEISNNWPNNLLETNVYKAPECCWQLFLTILKLTNTTSVIFKWGTSSLF